MRLPCACAFALSIAAWSFGCAVPSDETSSEDEIDETGDAPLAAGCPRAARVFSYNPNGWRHLAEAFAEHPSPCAEYYIHLPAIAGDHTQVRGADAVEQIHAYGPHFHALAEFHYGAWSAVTGMTWREKGRAFRKRMVEAGYDPVRDSWAINELPSSVRSSPTVREHVRELVQGLWEGPSGSPKNRGLVFVIVMGEATQNLSVYKPLMEDWTLDAAFWEGMRKHVRWWAQEVYADPHTVCVESSHLATKTEHLDEYLMHPARLAYEGPAEAHAARSFFDRSYMPFMSAFWNSDVYGTHGLKLTTMKNFVSTEVYAARAWSKHHRYPDWRIGVAWNEHVDGATEDEIHAFAARTARAIEYAYSNLYDEASRACSPSGAYTYCHCELPGAEFNTRWNIFDTW